jgi:hypothetical protein
MMKSSGVPFTHICEWKRHSPSSGSSSSPGWSLVVATLALGSVSMIHLPLSGSSSESEYASNSEAFTSATSNYFERQSTMLCQGLLWKSHRFPVSFFVFPVSFFAWRLDWLSWYYPYFLYPLFYGWGHPFLAFLVRGSQSQIVASFVWSSAQFWRHIDRLRPRMRCLEIPFHSRCIYVEHHDTWEPDVTLNIWYPAWCTRYGRYLWNLALLGLFLAAVWSIWYISCHNFWQGSIFP